MKLRITCLLILLFMAGAFAQRPALDPLPVVTPDTTAQPAVKAGEAPVDSIPLDELIRLKLQNSTLTMENLQLQADRVQQIGTQELNLWISSKNLKPEDWFLDPSTWTLRARNVYTVDPLTGQLVKRDSKGDKKK